MIHGITHTLRARELLILLTSILINLLMLIRLRFYSLLIKSNQIKYIKTLIIRKNFFSFAW